MKFNLKASIQILILFIVAGIYAQPSEAYIKKIRGNFDTNWLLEKGIEAETTNLNWQLQTAVGFKNISNKARRKAVLANTWNFHKVEEGKASIDKEKVSLPHSFDRKRNYTSGWYFSKSILAKNKEKRYFLKFDRVQVFCEIYINGKVVGHHFGGFTPFDFDITDFLKSGENSIAIFVKDQSASLDNGKIYNQVGTTRLGLYNPEGTKKLPGGIGRQIYIEETAKVNLKEVFVKTSTRKKTLEIDYKISNNRTKKTNITFEVFNWKNGKKVDLPFESIQLDKSYKDKKTYKIKWENPKLWSPDSPNLYVLRTTVKHKNNIDIVDTRFGFREFWVDGKQFVLNGVPTRLRGQSHYRGKVQNVAHHKETFLINKELFQENACRIHAIMPSNEIIYAADEVGILLINQSAIWSVNKPFYSNGGEWFAKNIENEFEEWVKRDRNNPSVIIWDVENEMLRFNFETYKWIKYLPNYIKKNDTTRPINYSGAGWFDESQEMVSLHMQEHYTRIMKDWKAKGSRPLIMGEFWVGGRSEQRLSNSPEFKSVFERNLEEALLYEEKLLEMRNLGVAALMPFRTGLLSFDKNPIKNGGVFDFSDGSKIYTQPDFILQKMRHALQPVTTFFWPRETYLDKSKNLKKELVVCNDSENDNRFKLEWKWNNKSYSKEVFIKAGSQERVALNLESFDKNELLIASIFLGAKNISTDTLFIKPFQKPILNQTKKIQVYNDEKLVSKLKKQGFDAFSSDEIPAIKDNVIWVFPEYANNRILSVIKKDIELYLQEGGTVLSLKQDQTPTWFPVKFQFSSANQSNLHNYSKMGWEGLNKDLFFSTEAPIYDVEHPVFKNLNATKLQYWNNYDGRVADDVFARPSSNNKYEQGNWTTLSGGTRREQISLAEIFYGKGILLACQLNIIDNLENPQANSLFVNMIHYLSERKAEKLQQKIKISGDKNVNEFAKLLSVNTSVFEGAKPEKGNYLFAFDGTTLDEIKNWQAKGGKVIVLSPKLASTFNDVEIAKNKNGLLATKINEHPLLKGISSANFLSTENSLANLYFKKIPKEATIILQGFVANSTFWRVEKAYPILISIPFIDDEILLSTIELDEKPIVSQQEFFAQLLTNCGVEIPFLKEPKLAEIAIKKTVPIKIDGNLEEWLQDMEDRLVSPYIHAKPIYLTSESKIQGPPIFDLNLSAINYMMWNTKALHIAGVVFMEKKFFGGEKYPDNKNYTQEIRLNDDVIIIQVLDTKISIIVNGKIYETILVKTANIDAREMTDAIKLQFNYTHASGKIKIWGKMIGETFELKIPWELLKTKVTDQKGKGLFTLENKDNKIQVPLKGEINNKENWLPIEIKN